VRAELLFERSCVLGESPRWDDLAEVVRWVDIDRGELYAVDLAGSGFEMLPTGSPCGALVLDRSGAPVIAVGSTWYRVDPDGVRTISHLERPGFRFNDAGVDSLGRVWSGTMRSDENVGPPASGVLYRISSPEPLQVAVGLFAANGIGWSPDEAVVYCVDSGANAILRASFDLEAADVGPFERWIDIEAGMADGLAVDNEGGVWVAVWGTGKVVRFAPAGALTHTLTVPTPNVTAVTFAGHDLRSMVITTAATGTTGDRLAGSLFIAEAPVAGLPLHRAGMTSEEGTR
jgi:sugar lactone lactonase YvrE